MAAFALAANVCAQSWNMVVAHSNGTYDTIAVEKVKDVTFFKKSSEPVTHRLRHRVRKGSCRFVPNGKSER